MPGSLMSINGRRAAVAAAALCLSVSLSALPGCSGGGEGGGVSANSSNGPTVPWGIQEQTEDGHPVGMRSDEITKCAYYAENPTTGEVERYQIDFGDGTAPILNMSIEAADHRITAHASYELPSDAADSVRKLYDAYDMRSWGFRDTAGGGTTRIEFASDSASVLYDDGMDLPGSVPKKAFSDVKSLMESYINESGAKRL